MTVKKPAKIGDYLFWRSSYVYIIILYVITVYFRLKISTDKTIGLYIVTNKMQIVDNYARNRNSKQDSYKL